MTKVAPASASTQRAYAAIGTALASDGVELSNMFGMPAMKCGGKAFAGLFGDAMVFKLAGDAHAEALALKGSVLFDPSGMGRAMKAWVVVESAHAKKWSSLAKLALQSLTEAPVKAAKQPAPRKR